MKILKKDGKNLMAREILLTLDKKASSFVISKVDRKKLYGFKKRIYLDEKGIECPRANIEEETGIVFFNSDTSSCNVDFKGNFLDKKDIEAVDEKGKELKKHDSTLGREVPLSSINVEDALNIQINSVYYLEPKEFDSKLKTKLDQGEIYRFDFNYFSDFKLEDGIILKAEQDYFALIGRNTTCHWIAENIDNLPEEIEEFEDNDLDFEMM